MTHHRLEPNLCDDDGDVHSRVHIRLCVSPCVYYADPFKFGPSVCISECAQSALISIDIFLSGKKEERTRKRKEVGRQGERVVDGLERADSAEGTRSLLHTPVVAAAAHPHTFLSGQTHKSPSSYPLCFFVSLLSPFNPSSTLSRLTRPTSLAIMSRLCQQVNVELGTNGPMRNRGNTETEKTIRVEEKRKGRWID